ncbi:uncharacterized protein [Nicotiana tomentosiformis]|uniref:uncharacterized protein n=1 Tax=Nicotiana tomentosiformis TaxID=4098 RepID=UPI00388C6C3C
MDNVFKLHGIPKTIVSNKDVVFTSKFWKELFKLQKVSLLTSTAYQPQIDGQTGVVNRSLQAREATFRAVKSHLLRAQSRIKSQAGKGRADRTYAVCEWVYVKLQPYRQLSLNSHSFQKLSAKYFGPFQIIQRVGQVAYTLALPPQSNIHPTFHISQLKNKLGTHTTSPTLPVVHAEHGHVLLTLEAILDRRLAPNNVRATTPVLVKWLNDGPEDSTWEDWQEFQLKFSFFNP